MHRLNKEFGRCIFVIDFNSISFNRSKFRAFFNGYQVYLDGTRNLMYRHLSMVEVLMPK